MSTQEEIQSALRLHSKLAEADEKALLHDLQRVYGFCVARDETFPVDTVVELARSPWSAMGALSCGLVAVAGILVDEHKQVPPGPPLVQSMETSEATFEDKEACYNEARGHVMAFYGQFTHP